MNPLRSIKSLLPQSILGTNTKCPLCLKTINHEKKAEVQIIKCKKCDIGITSPPPKNTTSTDLIWENSYSQDRAKTRPIWIREAEKRLDWMHLWLPEGSILELGCGFGEFLEVASANGHDSYGIEPSPSGRKAAQDKSSAIIFESTEEWKHQNANLKVDAIAAWHAIEHLPDPIRTLKSISDDLKKGGYFFGEIPNYKCKTAQELVTNWEHANTDFHFYHFTSKSISKLFSAAKLEIIQTQEITSRIYWSLKGWKQRKNDALIQGFPFPDEELLRIVARKR